MDAVDIFVIIAVGGGILGAVHGIIGLERAPHDKPHGRRFR
jgi:hypothetical protein